MKSNRKVDILYDNDNILIERILIHRPGYYKYRVVNKSDLDKFWDVNEYNEIPVELLRELKINDILK